jgi:hypothetical protein
MAHQMIEYEKSESVRRLNKMSFMSKMRKKSK